MKRLLFQACLSGLSGMLLAGCRPYPAIDTLHFELVLSPERNISTLDIAQGDTSQLVKILDEQAQTCTGANEFKEYNPKASVVIRDSSNSIIGRGLLGPGRILHREQAKTGVMLYRGCRFQVQIPLSRPARVYRIDIANGKHKDYLHISSLAASKGRLTIDLD